MTPNEDTPTPKPKTIRSLEDRVVRYDFTEMQEQLQFEFNITNKSSALVSQESIGDFFDLEDNDNGRN